METSKDRPNTPPSLKLLEQRVHELVGGGGSTELPLDNVVDSRELRSGRVKCNLWENFSTSALSSSFQA